MGKRVIIVHGWGGDNKGGWFPWIGKSLESKGYDVVMPNMPDTWKPKIEEWVSHLKEVVGELDENTYFIGHSIGCQAIMRYLEDLDQAEKIGGVIFVAGWFNLTNETWDEDYTLEIASPWIDTKIDFEKIKSHCNKFIDIASNDDPYVPISDADIFKNKLNAKIIIEKKKGHIDTDTLPSLLKSILRISK